MAKYLFVAPFSHNTIPFPEDMDLDWERDPVAEPIGGGYVLMSPTVQGKDTPAIVLLSTTPANRDTLDADPDWVYLSEIVEESDGV